jgi:hypothetical protein
MEWMRPHRLPVADTSVEAGIVIRVIDINEGNTVSFLIATPQEANLPKAEGAASVVEIG